MALSKIFLKLTFRRKRNAGKSQKSSMMMEVVNLWQCNLRNGVGQCERTRPARPKNRTKCQLVMEVRNTAR